MVQEIEKLAEDRLKKIDNLRKEIDKKFGKEALVDFTGGEIKAVPAISSGSLTLDKALGIGGWPQGRIVTVYGAESTSKTSIAIHAVVEAQKEGKLVAFCDFEASFDPFYAKNIGVNLNELFFFQPDSAETGMQMVEDLVKSGEFGLVVVDSVAAMVPIAELQGEIGQAHMSLQARLMGQVCRKLAPVCKKNNTTLFFINQVRSSMNPYGPSDVLPGGRALPFFSSIMVQLKKKEKVVSGKDDPTGNMFLARIMKNKVAPPFREASYEIKFGEGINKASEIIDLSVEYGFVQKGGAWYTFGEEKFQGKEKFGEYLKENPEISDDLESKIREKLYGN